MQTSSKRVSKTRYVAALIITSAMLTGCSYALAGTTVNTGAIDTTAKANGVVTWFDGENIKEANIQISDLTDMGSLPFKPDISRIPMEETMQLKCFKITSSDDITGLYDMQALSLDKEPILFVRTKYDGAIYPLGNNWYGVVLPNGYTDSFYIRIGNTYFEVK